MPVLSRTEIQIAEEVKNLHAQDDALSKVRAKTKVEQREIRLRVGTLISQVNESSLPMIAEKSGYTVARLKDFAFVRKQWPEGKFPADANYTALEELARDPERFSKITSGMSKRDARAAKGGKVDTPSRWSDDVKADFIKEALANNPEVARQIAADQAARAAVAEANLALLRQHQAKTDAARPAQKQSREEIEKGRVLNALDNIRYALTKALGNVMDQGLAGDAEVMEALEEIKPIFEGLYEYGMNATDIDAALSALLEENS